jgi:hypothetical protein
MTHKFYWEAKLSAMALRYIMDHYNSYIQDANSKDSFADGWRPVCIDEFIHCELAEIIRTNLEEQFDINWLKECQEIKKKLLS